MPTEQFANNASTTLAASMNALQTSLQVSSNYGFPSVTTASTNFFYASIGSEIVKVTNNPTVIWTIERGNQGTVAATHLSSDNVYCVVTKQTMLDIQADAAIGSQITSGVISSLPAAGNVGNVFIPTDSYYDQLFDNGTTWDYFYRGLKVTPPLAASNWTVVTGGNAALSDSRGALYFGTSSNTIQNLETFLRPIPATPYTITAKITPQFLMNGGVEVGMWGLVLTNGTLTTSAIQLFREYSAAASSQEFVVQNATYTSYAFAGTANVTNFVQNAATGSDVWFRISDSGATKVASISRDGINFLTVASLASATPFTPTHYGIAACLTGTTTRAWGISVPSITIT